MWTRKFGNETQLCLAIQNFVTTILPNIRLFGNTKSIKKFEVIFLKNFKCHKGEMNKLLLENTLQ